MKVHFIAIGGSAMHNLAIALSRKGMVVTGSDDEIFEPSRSRLEKQGVLPKTIGWDPSKITDDLDAVILGMHARENNPELLAAKEKNIPVYSYPEYLFEQSKAKIPRGYWWVTWQNNHYINDFACSECRADGS